MRHLFGALIVLACTTAASANEAGKVAEDFCHAVAAQALGIQTAGSGGSGGGSSSGSGGFSEPCYTCTEQGSLIYGGATDLGGGEFAY